MDQLLYRVIDNMPGSTVLPGPCRVLGFSGSQVLLIALPKRNGKSKQQQQTYLGAPFWEQTETLTLWLRPSAPRVFIHNPTKPAVTSQSDADLLAQAKTPRARTAVQNAIRRRDKRWKILRPLVRVTGRKTKATTVPTPIQLYTNPKLGEKLQSRAKAAGCSMSTLYTLLHLYWAGGLTKNALFTGHANCGAPGQHREIVTATGAKTRLFKADAVAHRHYVLDRELGREWKKHEDCEHFRLAAGYRLIKHGLSVHEAYIATMSVYWADHVADGHGGTYAVLWDAKDRPTENQFQYWGRVLNGGFRASEAMLRDSKRKQKSDTHGGSEQDLTVAVGQLAVFDGTKTDVYLTARHSRVKKLPPMLRLMIKDVRTGVICGWYLGWDPASPQTAIQAIFHAASSKVEEARRLGIEIDEDVIPAILHWQYLADHGELKAEAITEFEEQFGIGITYVEVDRGDKKGGAETQHHKDHKQLDHRLPGTTLGKPRQRGDRHPAETALYNSFEYRREFFEHVIRNNQELVPDLAPTEMLVNFPDIEPTRINIFKWLRERQSGEAPRDIDQLRAFALPDVDAVIRKNGVYPIFKVAGSRVIIPRFRFTSKALLETGLLSTVKRTGKTIPTRLKLSEHTPERAWLPTKDGVIELTCATRPERIHRTMSIEDWKSLHEDRLLRADMAKPARDQADANRLLRRKSTEAQAASELKAELDAMPKEPSRAAIVAGLDANLAEERAEEAAQASFASVGTTVVSVAAKSVANTSPERPAVAGETRTSSASRPNSSASVMDAFNDEED